MSEVTNNQLLGVIITIFFCYFSRMTVGTRLIRTQTRV